MIERNSFFSRYSMRDSTYQQVSDEICPFLCKQHSVSAAPLASIRRLRDHAQKELPSNAARTSLCCGLDWSNQPWGIIFSHMINLPVPKILRTILCIQTVPGFTSFFNKSPPAIASNWSDVISSAASIPAIFCTISFNINRSRLKADFRILYKTINWLKKIIAIFCVHWIIYEIYLFWALSWFATYCNNPVNSMLYFLNIAPQKEARDCNHKDILVPSCLNLSLSAPASASTRQYPNTSYEIFVKYFKESTTGPEINNTI